MPTEIARATVLYDGPTRGVCPLFPPNLSSHRTVVLAGIGFARTGLVLVTDPVLEVRVIEMTAPGKGAGSAKQTC